MSVERLPEVALFSSATAEPFLKALKRHLREKTTSRSWRQVIRPGQFTLEAVQDQLLRSDFAIVLVTPDTFTVDLANGNGIGATPRLNVVVEIGLALGELGRDRVFIVRVADAALPTELAGFTYVAAAGRSDAAASKIARSIAGDIKARGLRFAAGEVAVEEAHEIIYAWMRSRVAKTIHHLSPTRNAFPMPPVVDRYDDEACAFVKRGGLYCYLFADVPHKRGRAKKLLSAGKATNNARAWRLRADVAVAPFLGNALVLGEQMVVYFDQSQHRTRTFILRDAGSVVAFTQTFSALAALSEEQPLSEAKPVKPLLRAG